MNNKSSYHIAVLLQQAIEALNVKKGERYIDGTLGGGGHTEEILKLGGRVLAIDRDEDAIQEAKSKFKRNSNLEIVKGNFKDIALIAQKYAFNKCSGILLDLGTSVHQLKDFSRGFSFLGHDKLDMRMDVKQKLSAYEIVNEWSKNELMEIFKKYGEEGEAREIAEAVIAERKKKKIEYTDELAKLIMTTKKRKELDIHPATKVFQSLRIEVNGELEALREGLENGLKLLDREGRFAVISFHSLEDRIVKQSFIDFEKKNLGRIITKKPITANRDELKLNKKSRSAKLRVFEKN